MLLYNVIGDFVKASIKDKKKNARLFPIYRMISADLLFFYAVSFLFLTQIKGFSASQVLYLESIYTLLKIAVQVPCLILIEKFGKCKSLIIANLAICVQTLFFIFATGFFSIVIAYIFCAFGFVIKIICEPSLLYESVTTKKGKGFFALIDGRGTAYYFYLEGVSSVIAGILYTVNGYIPMFMCLAFSMISAFLASRFIDIPSEEKEYKGIKKYFKDLKSGFKYIFKSNRLKAFLLFYAIFAGIISLITVYRRSLLTDLNVSPVYFGMIFAFLNIICGIASLNQDKFHDSFKNKTLKVISLTFIISCIVVGLICILPLQHDVTIAFVLLMFLAQFIVRGPVPTLAKRYLSNFSTANIRTRIFSANDITESIGRTIIVFLGGLLLDVTNTSNAFIIVGILGTIILLLILNYMKSRIGLKPEDYKTEDIQYIEMR